jgi:hypothetical protein
MSTNKKSRLPSVPVQTYETRLPSDNSKVVFRPYKVKEEKILMIALQTGKEKEQLNALMQVVGACVMEPEEFNPSMLPMFDLEWMFVQQRMRSIGESVEPNIYCEKCKKQSPVKIDLNDVKTVALEGHSPKIEIHSDGGIGMTLRYPSVEMLKDYDLATLETNVETAFELIIDCIESIYDPEDVHKAKDCERSELHEFVNELTKPQFTKIETFFKTMPKLRLEVPYICLHNDCKHKGKRELTGIKDFFGSV